MTDNQTTDQPLNLDVGSDHIGRFHFLAYQPGVKNARAEATSLCGKFNKKGLRAAAFFDIGDSRGQVYYEKGCDECLELLEI